MPKIDQYRTIYHDQISSQIIDESWNFSKLLDSRNDLALILSKLLNENLRIDNKNSFINDSPAKRTGQKGSEINIIRPFHSQGQKACSRKTIATTKYPSPAM